MRTRGPAASRGDREFTARSCFATRRSTRLIAEMEKDGSRSVRTPKPSPALDRFDDREAPRLNLLPSSSYTNICSYGDSLRHGARAVLGAAAEERRLPPRTSGRTSCGGWRGSARRSSRSGPGEAFFAVDGLRGIHGGERAGVVEAARRAARCRSGSGWRRPASPPSPPPGDGEEVVPAGRPAATSSARSRSRPCPAPRPRRARGGGPGRDPAAARHRHRWGRSPRSRADQVADRFGPLGLRALRLARGEERAAAPAPPARGAGRGDRAAGRDRRQPARARPGAARRPPPRRPAAQGPHAARRCASAPCSATAAAGASSRGWAGRPPRRRVLRTRAGAAAGGAAGAGDARCGCGRSASARRSATSSSSRSAARSSAAAGSARRCARSAPRRAPRRCSRSSRSTPPRASPSAGRC